LHAKDAELPKVLYIPKAPDEDDSAAEPPEPPSWLTSAAMAYKEGRKYKVKFAVVAAKDAARVAKRFGHDEERLPLLIGCQMNGDAGGTAHTLSRGEMIAGGGATVKSVKAFAGELVSGSLTNEGEGATPLPAFPEPTRPRKQSSASLEEFTHESLPLSCYENAARPLCVLAVLGQPAGQGCPSAVGRLAQKFRNDKNVGFGCVGAAGQKEFLNAFGLSSAELPALLAVKGGKRPRMARMPGTLTDELAPATAFVDGLIGGGTSFSRLSDGLPSLEPPYLLDKDEM